MGALLCVDAFVDAKTFYLERLWLMIQKDLQNSKNCTITVGVNDPLFSIPGLGIIVSDIKRETTQT